MNKKWLNVGLWVLQAVQAVQATVHDKNETKKEKAIEISDTLLLALQMGLGKEVLSHPTVVDTRSKLIDALVAFEKAVAEVKFNLDSEKTNK